MERINFVIGSNGNIGKSLVNYETNLKKNVIGIDKSNKIHKPNKFYSHWKLDCTQPKILESKLNDYYKKKKFKIDNLVLCAVLDSVPMIDLKKISYVIGKNTNEAVRSGFYWGYAGLIDNMIKLIKRQTKSDFKIILTGGLADLFKNSIITKCKVDKDLTIKGIIKITKNLVYE